MIWEIFDFYSYHSTLNTRQIGDVVLEVPSIRAVPETSFPMFWLFRKTVVNLFLKTGNLGKSGLPEIGGFRYLFPSFARLWQRFCFRSKEAGLSCLQFFRRQRSLPIG